MKETELSVEQKKALVEAIKAKAQQEEQEVVYLSREDFLIACDLMFQEFAYQNQESGQKLQEIQGMVTRSENYQSDPDFRVKYVMEPKTGNLGLMVEPKGRMGFK